MADEDIPSNIKKEISRLRSEVRKLQDVKKDIGAFSGMATGNYWTATGMPWIGADGRKAVLTEYFWQPIRGQPRRVDTNELRQFSQDFWVSACVKTLMDEISSLAWDIVPMDEYQYDWVEDSIKTVKDFLLNPNKNNESFGGIIRALMKDILEIDAGVIVKVFDLNSYNFDEIEPKSGAPVLKPKGQRRMTEIYVRDGASFLKEIDKFGFERGFWQYSYQIPAHPMWFNKDEIVYVQEHNRSMSCYGYARTQSILDIVKSLHYSTLYNKRFFEETAIPDGALSLLDTNEVEMREFRSYWNNEFKAQPHKVAIMNKDLKWQPFAVSQQELQFLETQKWYFNIVISSFGLSPSELGITDDLNRATSATQSELVKRKGIRPFLKLLEANINKGVVDEFGFEGIQFQFIYDDPAEKNSRLTNWNLELTMGVKTINEVRNEMGLEPIKNGDVSNNMRDMMGGGYGDNNQNDDSNSQGDKTENQESPGYTDERNRQEGVSSKTQKGVDDGQYYREQPLTQPRRLSGAMFQPQMNKEDLVNCPICGRPTLATLNAEENLLDDMRCTSCGARFNSKDLLQAPMMEEMTNTLQANNNSKPIYNKSITKSKDDLMDVKAYCGFDCSKSFPFAESFASSSSYKSMLIKYLNDIGKEKVEDIISILKGSLLGNDSIYNVAQQINEVIDDYPRAQLIARTEIIRLANKGNLDRMKAKGTKYVKFISAPEDGRLCRKCAEKDGKIYSIKQAENVIPLHPRCRCTWTEVEDI